jgi:hypothetical protein
MIGCWNGSELASLMYPLDLGLCNVGITDYNHPYTHVTGLLYGHFPSLNNVFLNNVSLNYCT